VAVARGIRMHYTLYINLSSPSSIYHEAECNKGIDRVPALLDEISRRGEAVQIRNASEMSWTYPDCVDGVGLRKSALAE